MKIWKSLFAAIAALLVIGPFAFANGTTATLSWLHPTAYTDGSVLPVSAIKETVIEWRRPGSSVVVGSVTVAAPANSRVVTNLVCGDFNFLAYTVTTADVASDPTAPVLYATGISCKPNPPTGLGAI